MSGWASLLAAILGALFDALAQAFAAQRADADRISAHEKIGADRAALETDRVVLDIAEEQARANARRDSVLDIARQLRNDAAGTASGG